MNIPSKPNCPSAIQLTETLEKETLMDHLAKPTYNAPYSLKALAEKTFDLTPFPASPSGNLIFSQNCPCPDWAVFCKNDQQKSRSHPVS